MSEIEARWDEIKNNIKDEYDISPISFETWIVPLKIYDEKNNVIRIIVPSDQDHAINYINKNYKDYFRIMITEMMGQNYDVKFILEKETEVINEGESSYNNTVSISDNINYLNANLIPKYKFETFVVGSNNRFAQNVSLAVAESPGKMYNPLFIYGGPGLGKTHLMHSIGHYILEHNPNMKVLYVTCEFFTNEVVESIRSGNTSSINEMRNKYRSVDVLMIDDVQFIIGKEGTQMEFFNTFNALRDMGKQIILTSDKPPKDLKGLDERLISRFEWGLVADIQSPDYETRLAILKRNAESMNINLSNDIFEYIADNIKYNIRELESALNRIAAQYSINKDNNITIEDIDYYLKDIIKPDNNKQITVEYIIETVAREYNVTYDDIVSSKRNAEYAFPRQIVMYICRRLLDTSLEGVAKILGKKDHTTIMYGANKIDTEMKKDENFKNKVEYIINKIKN